MALRKGQPFILVLLFFQQFFRNSSMSCQTNLCFILFSRLICHVSCDVILFWNMCQIALAVIYVVKNSSGGGGGREKSILDETYNTMISFFISKRKVSKNYGILCLSFALHACVLHHEETFHFLLSLSSYPVSIFTYTQACV